MTHFHFSVITGMYNYSNIFNFAGAMSPKFGDGYSLKRYAPELLVGVIFDVYDQHTQIITELDIKLNKWHIQLKSYVENQLKQNKIFKNYDPTVESNREPKTQHARAISLCQQANRWKWS